MVDPAPSQATCRRNATDKAIAAATVLLALGTCNWDNALAEPDGNQPAGSVSALIDGAAWQATTALTVSQTGGFPGFAGSRACQTTTGARTVQTAVPQGRIAR